MCLMFLDSGRYYTAGLPDVDLTAFARNVVNAWLALGVLFVLVCLKRCLYLVGCCVEGLDLYLAEDALKLVCCVADLRDGDGCLEFWSVFR